MKKTCLITGASRGIGFATALALAEEGFDVAAVALPDPERMDELRQKVGALGRQFSSYEVDLGKIEAHAEVIGRVIADFGAIDCLVNNAGVAAPARGDLLDLGPEAFDQVLDVNLRGTFFFTQAVARQMIATASRNARLIVTVSSVSATLASPERGEYCMSKAGLAMLTKLFALRLARDGIAVFEVRPGVIRTPMTSGVADKYDRRIADGLVPMGRWGEPEDIGAAVAALASGKFQFATGSVLNLDGGLSLPRL